VTLHVGAGTFQPVRVDHVPDHRMHAELTEVPEAHLRGGGGLSGARWARRRRGTTAVRALESAAQVAARAIPPATRASVHHGPVTVPRLDVLITTSTCRNPP